MMMNNPGRQPKVSVVITAYNAERYIHASVSAVLAQSYPNFEIIVVDDGSSDRTDEICAAVNDSRLRYLHRGRLGRARALNEGIAASEGEYIAINDADDLSLPCRLECSMNFARQCQDLAFLGTGYIRTAEFHDQIPVEALSICREVAPDQAWRLSPATVYRRNVFVNSTLLYPKSIWQRIGGYDERLPLSEDYDFQLRALQCGKAFMLPCRTVFWYANPGSYFKQKSRREQLDAIKFIRLRAHQLLKLPLWLRFYHPAWRMASGCTRVFPSLLPVVNGVRAVMTKRPLAR
jgi:glycosyltransferase involved in cell wall biosynthesis